MILQPRKLILSTFGGLALAVVVLLGAAGWLLSEMLPGTSPEETRDLILIFLGGAGVLLVILTIALWAVLDHAHLVRDYDHRSLPARPEFFDFEDLNPPMHVQEFAGVALRDINYVVFDTETTGLRPSKGDEVISIAGVRILNGEIQEDDPFTRLVNPGMPIPKGSIKFHGITDDMVVNEAPIGDVLPEFKEYVGDAVLVAHNAAFDMKFLRLKEEATGVVFGNLVLDSLLLSVFLEHQSENHSLDAIAERMGVNIEGRHTALGDSIATAKVFLRMLHMLEARGITTLRQAVEASNKIEHVRKMQEKF